MVSADFTISAPSLWEYSKRAIYNADWPRDISLPFFPVPMLCMKASILSKTGHVCEFRFIHA